MSRISVGLTRREAVAELALGAAAVALVGCGAHGAAKRAIGGSTLRSTYADPHADGVLEAGPGEALIERTELAAPAAPTDVLATIAHLTDTHVLDAQSPARVPFLRRLGAPFNSTFRPQETLSAQVLAGALRSIRALRPDAVIQGGDLIDNAQANELALALAMLRGERVTPGSGSPGYTGVQSEQNPDPFYYRPDVDAPRHPGMLEAACRPLDGVGVGAACYPVLGDHDVLVQGVLVANALTQGIAVGSRAVWDLPVGLRLPRGVSLGGEGGASPDALAAPALIDGLIEQLGRSPSVAVSADSRRAELDVSGVLAALRRSSRSRGSGAFLDYGFDVGRGVRVVVLDLVRREGGSGGVVHAAQEAWLARELARSGGRWVLVFSHQPLTSAAGGERLLALLDRAPRVLAAIWGHTHRNEIRPRRTHAGGYWLISTCSLIDHPQELRALRVRETHGGGVALETWMLDHAPDNGLGDISRELAYLDSQGGRPQGFAGTPLDRNVRLFKA